MAARPDEVPVEDVPVPDLAAYGAAVDGITGIAGEARLAAAVTLLAETLASEAPLAELLQAVVQGAGGLGAARTAEVLLADSNGRLRPRAGTADAARPSVVLAAVREGPCLECFRTGRPVARDLEGRGAVLVVPVRLPDGVVGTLAVLGAGPAAPGSSGTAALQAIADLAAVGVAQDRLRTRTSLADDLQDALAARVLIEQAKGVLAATAGIGVQHAHRVLREHARAAGLPLADVAAAVVDRRIDIEVDIEIEARGAARRS